MTEPRVLLLEAARSGDERAFRALLEPLRSRLHAHCYRLLASLSDADDALQETFVGAWQGLRGFEGRSSLETWLFTIATHASLRIASRRLPRCLPSDEFAAADPRAELADPWSEARWIEPYPDADVSPTALRSACPDARYEEMESIELAFIAALQTLPATQRAVLVLRDVLGFSADEAAVALDTSVAAANSALQRARDTLSRALPTESQARLRRTTRADEHRAAVERFVDAWRRSDVDAIVSMLADDATFTMPPLSAWFRGRADIRAFLETKVFTLRWQFRECRVSGQASMAAYRWNETSSSFELEVINVFTFRGDQLVAITAFPNRTLCRRFGLPLVWSV